MRRFIIVSKQRSGTNHFVSLLKSHPQIASFGEIFRDGFKVSEFIGNHFAHYEKFDSRVSDPNRFLDDLEAFVKTDAYQKYRSDSQNYPHSNDEIDILGFKVFPKQFLPVSQIANRDGLKVIRLERTNLLACYSSNRIAKATGQGSVGVRQEVERAKIDFDPEDFERFVAFHCSRDEDVDQALEVIPDSNVFHMKYTEVNSEDVLKNLLTFLEVAPRPMTSLTQKRNPSRIVERFNNPEEVIAYLERHDRTEWLEE
ncbi:MAG: hypothetical protein ACWA49_10810 [Ruegeria sp.]